MTEPTQQQPSSEQPPQPTRRIKGWHILVAITVAVVAVVVVTSGVRWAIYQSSGRADVDRACAEAQLELLDPDKSKNLTPPQRKALEDSVTKLCKK